jgi:hypothetical protein
VTAFVYFIPKVFYASIVVLVFILINFLIFSRVAVHAREALIPYIYNATRQAFDDGISLLRPMYYEFPQNAEAYAADGTGMDVFFISYFA